MWDGISYEARAKKLRRDTIDLAVEYNNGHIASAFSIVEILIAVFDNFDWKHDRFILSKGHGCLSYYAILREMGFNPKISGHPDIQPEQGIPCTTGSLGHGLPIGVGMALAKKLKGEPGTVYVLMGDGECQEGTTWESINLAVHHELDNLTVLLDRNGFQALGKTNDILNIRTYQFVFRLLGCLEVDANGHNIYDLKVALRCKDDSKCFGIPDKYQPKFITIFTTKGKGLPFMENKPEWHNKMPNQEQLEEAYRILA